MRRGLGTRSIEWFLDIFGVANLGGWISLVGGVKSRV